MAVVAVYLLVENLRDPLLPYLPEAALIHQYISKNSCICIVHVSNSILTFLNNQNVSNLISAQLAPSGPLKYKIPYISQSPPQSLQTI